MIYGIQGRRTYFLVLLTPLKTYSAGDQVDLCNLQRIPTCTPETRQITTYLPAHVHVAVNLR